MSQTFLLHDHLFLYYSIKGMGNSTAEPITEVWSMLSVSRDHSRSVAVTAVWQLALNHRTWKPGFKFHSVRFLFFKFAEAAAASTKYQNVKCYSQNQKYSPRNNYSTCDSDKHTQWDPGALCWGFPGVSMGGDLSHPYWGTRELLNWSFTNQNESRYYTAENISFLTTKIQVDIILLKILAS